MLIGRAFLSAASPRSSAALNFLLNLIYFLRDFHSLDNHGNPKRSKQKVRDKRRGLDMAVLNHPIKSPNTSWKLARAKYPRVTTTCNNGVNLKGTGSTADPNSPLSVTIMITMSSRLNLHFRKIERTKTYKTEQQF